MRGAFENIKTAQAKNGLCVESGCLIEEDKRMSGNDLKETTLNVGDSLQVKPSCQRNIKIDCLMQQTIVSPNIYL